MRKSVFHILYFSASKNLYIPVTRLFGSLAENKSQNVPYDRDVADQRRKYGDSLMRKVEDAMDVQRRHENEQESKVAMARQRRQDEKDRQEAEEVRQRYPGL